MVSVRVRVRVPEDLARRDRRDHRVEPAEAVRRLAVALRGDDRGGDQAARTRLQPGVRERVTAFGQQLGGRDASHERRRRDLVSGMRGEWCVVQGEWRVV